MPFQKFANVFCGGRSLMVAVQQLNRAREQAVWSLAECVTTYEMLYLG
jgi:hypothetical protein